jgi:hypothetical protein
MNKTQTWKRIPNWFKGAVFGLLTYIVPLVPYKILEVPDGIYDRFFMTKTEVLLMSAVQPWHGIEYLLEYSGVDMLWSLLIGWRPFTPIVWILLGAFFAQKWGFFKGMLGLLVLEILMITSSAFVIAFLNSLS